MSAPSLIATLPQQVEAETAEAVRLHTIDTLAALEIGIRTGEGRAIANHYGDGDEAMAAAGMAAVARFSECDDIEVPSCLTPGSIAVPVALLWALDPNHFDRAVEAGYGVGLALARACGGVEALAKGVWPTLLAAPAIAAVTAAVARGMDDEETVQALALSLSGHSGRAGRPGGEPSGRWLVLGEAVLKGCRAVKAVRAGFEGDAELISPQWLATQTEPDLADPVCLDEVPRDAVRQVGLKPFICARQGANAIEALRRLLAQGIDVAEIASIEVYLPPAAVPVVTRPLDLGNRLSKIAHLGLQLSIVVNEPDRLGDVQRKAPFAERTLALAECVSVRAEPSLATGAASFPAVARVNTSGGMVESLCEQLPGDAGDPAPATMMESKFDRLSNSTRVRSLMKSLKSGEDFLALSRDTLSALTGRRISTDAGGAAVARFA